ncbi:MAG: hypothetical protein LC791_09010, partial [Acidobacteria bacterium]|nr:hypothetical protein [Acidobacteriota bacterium]
GVVLRVNAGDPYRPKVRVILNDQGIKLPQPYDVNLCEMNEGARGPHAIVAPLDPAAYGIDPLLYL